MTKKELVTTNKFDFFDQLSQVYFPDRYDWDNLKDSEKWDAFKEIYQDELKDYVFDDWNPNYVWTGINHFGYENQPTIDDLLADDDLDYLYTLHDNANNIWEPFQLHFPNMEAQVNYMAAFAAKGPEQNEIIRNQLLDFTSYGGLGLTEGETAQGVAHPKDVDEMSHEYLMNFYAGMYKLDSNKDGVWDLQNDKILHPGDEGNPIIKSPQLYGTYDAAYLNALDVWIHELKTHNFPDYDIGTLEQAAAYEDLGVTIDSDIPQATIDKYNKYFNPTSTIDVPIISAAKDFLGIEDEGIYTKARNKINVAETVTFNPLSLLNHPTLERTGRFDGKGLDIIRHMENNSMGNMFMGEITGYHGYTGIPYYDEDGDVHLVGGLKYSQPEWVEKNQDRWLFSATSGLAGLLDPLSAVSFFGAFGAGGAMGRRLSVSLINASKNTNTGRLFQKFGAPARVKSVQDFITKRLPSNDFTRKASGFLNKHVFTPKLFVGMSSSISAFGFHGFVNGMLTSRYNQRFSETDEYGNARGTIDTKKMFYDGYEGFKDSVSLGSIMGLSNHVFSGLTKLSKIYGRKSPILKRVGNQIENNKFLRGTKNTLKSGGRIVAEGSVMTMHDVYKHSDDFLLTKWNPEKREWEIDYDVNGGTQYDWDKISNAGGATFPFLLGLKGMHKSTNRVLRTILPKRPSGAPIEVVISKDNKFDLKNVKTGEIIVRDIDKAYEDKLTDWIKRNPEKTEKDFLELAQEGAVWMVDLTPNMTKTEAKAQGYSEKERIEFNKGLAENRESFNKNFNKSVQPILNRIKKLSNEGFTWDEIKSFAYSKKSKTTIGEILHQQMFNVQVGKKSNTRRMGAKYVEEKIYEVINQVKAKEANIAVTEEKYQVEEISDKNQNYSKTLDKTIIEIKEDIKHQKRGEDPQEVKTREEILEKIKGATNEEIFEIVREEGIKEFTPTKDSELIQYQEHLLEGMEMVRNLLGKVKLNKDGTLDYSALNSGEKFFISSESISLMDIYTGGILQNLSTDVGLSRYRQSLKSRLGREPSNVEFNKYKLLKQQEVDNWHVIKSDLIDRFTGAEPDIQVHQSSMHPQSKLGSGSNKKRMHIKVKLDEKGEWKPVEVEKDGKGKPWVDYFNKKESRLKLAERDMRGEGWMDFKRFENLVENRDYTSEMLKGNKTIIRKNLNLRDNLLSGEEKEFTRDGEIIYGENKVKSYSKKSVDKLVAEDQNKVPVIEKSFEEEGLYREDKDMKPYEIPKGLYDALTGRPDGILRRVVKGLEGKKSIPVIKFIYEGKEAKQELVAGRDGVFVKLGDSTISHITKSFDKAFLSDWLMNTRHKVKEGRNKYNMVAKDLRIINTILKETGKKGILDLTSRDMLEFFNKMQIEKEKLGQMTTIDAYWRSFPMELSKALQQRFGKKEFWNKDTAEYKIIKEAQEAESIERISIRDDLLKSRFKTETGDMNLTKVVNKVVNKVSKLKDIKLNEKLSSSEKISNEKQALYVEMLLEYALRSSELNRLTFSHIIEKGEYYQIDLLKDTFKNYKVKGHKDPDGFIYTKNVKGMAKGTGNFRRRIISDKYVQEIKRIMKEEGKTKEDLIFSLDEAGQILPKTAREVNDWLGQEFGVGAINSRHMRAVAGRLLTETVPKGKKLRDELRLEPHQMNLWNHLRGGGTDPFFKNTGEGVSKKNYQEHYNSVIPQKEIQDIMSTRIKEVLKLSKEAPEEVVIEETLQAMDASERISEGINKKGKLKEGYTEKELTEDITEVTQNKIKAGEIKEKAPEEIKTKAPIETVKVGEKDVERRPKSQVYKTFSKDAPKDRTKLVEKLKKEGFSEEDIQAILAGDKKYIPNQSIIDGWEKGYVNIDGKIITRKDYVNAVKNRTGMPDVIYYGEEGVVKPLNLGSKTIFKVYKGGDKPITLLKELRKDSKAIEMGIEKVPDTHAAANEFIAKYFKAEGYDYVEFSNVSRKQLGIEYVHTNSGKSFAEKVEHAELYAKQSGRGEKYKKEDADFIHPVYGKAKQINREEINKSLNVSKKQLSEKLRQKILPETRKAYHDRFNMKDPSFSKPVYRGNMPFAEFGPYRPIFSMKVGGKEAFFYRSSGGAAGEYRGKIMPFLGLQKNWVIKDISQEGKRKSFEESLARYPEAIKKATKYINEKIPMEKEFPAERVKFGAKSEMTTKGQEAWDKYVGEFLKGLSETKSKTIGDTVTKQDWMKAIRADFKDIIGGTLNKLWSNIKNARIGLTIEVTDPQEFIRRIKQGEIKPKEKLDEFEPIIEIISRDIDLKAKPLDALNKIHSYEGTLNIKNKTAVKNYVKLLKRRFEEIRRSEGYSKEELSGIIVEVAALAKVLNPELFRLSEKTDSASLTKVGEFLTKYPGQTVEKVKYYKKLKFIEDIQGLAILNKIKPEKLKDELLNIHGVKDGDLSNASIPKLKSIKEFYYTEQMFDSPILQESFHIKATQLFNELQKNTSLWKKIKETAFTIGAVSGARGNVLDIIRAVGKKTGSKVIEEIASDLINHDVLKKNTLAKFDGFHEKAIELIERDTNFMVGPMRVKSYIAEGLGGIKGIAKKLGLRTTGDYPGPVRRRIAEYVLRNYIYKNMKYLDKGHLEDQTSFLKFDKKSKTTVIDAKEKKNAEKFLNRVFENPKTRTKYKNTTEGKIVKTLTQVHNEVWKSLTESYKFNLTETEYAWLDSQGYFKPVKSGFYLHRKFSKDYGNAQHLFSQSQSFEKMYEKEINKETNRLIKVYSKSELLDGKPYDKNNPEHFNIVRTNAINNVVNSVFQGYEFSENSLEPSIALKRKADLPRRVFDDTKNKWVETRETDFENILSSYLRKAGNQIATIRYFPWLMQSSNLKTIKSLQKPSIKAEFFKIIKNNKRNEGAVGVIMDAIMFQTELFKGEKWYNHPVNRALTGTGAWLNRRIVKNTLMLAAPKNLAIGMVNNAIQSEVGMLLKSNLKMLDISTARKMRGKWGFMEHAAQSLDKEWKGLGKSKNITDELFEMSGFPTSELMVRFQRLVVAHSELPTLIDYLRRPDIVKTEAKTGVEIREIDPLKKETIRRLKEDYFTEEEINIMETYGLGTAEVPWAIQSKHIKALSGLRKSLMDKSFRESPDGMPIDAKARLQTKIDAIYDKYMYMSNVGTHGTTSPLFLPWMTLPSHSLGGALNQLLLYKKIPISATYNVAKRIRRIKKHNTWHPLLRWSLGALSTGMAMYAGNLLIGLKHKALNTTNPLDYEDDMFIKFWIGMNNIEFGSYMKLLYNWNIPGNGGFMANVSKELEVVNLSFVADVLNIGIKGGLSGAIPVFGRGGVIDELATKWFTLYSGIKKGVIDRDNVALNDRKEMNHLFRLYKSEEYTASGKYKFFEPGPKYWNKEWNKPKDRPKLALHNAYFYDAHQNKDYKNIINSLYSNVEPDNKIGIKFNVMYADAITSKSSVKMDKAFDYLLTQTFKQNPEFLNTINKFVTERDDNGMLKFLLVQALDDNFSPIFENNINAKDEFPEITDEINYALKQLDKDIDDSTLSLFERERFENKVEDYFVSEAADNVSSELNEILNLIVSPLRMSTFDSENLVSTNSKFLIWAASKDEKLGTNYVQQIFKHFQHSEVNQYLINYIFNEFLTHPDSDVLDNYFREDGAIDLKPNWLKDENFDSDATIEIYKKILKIEKKVKKISMYNKRKNKKDITSDLASLIDSIQTTV